MGDLGHRPCRAEAGPRLIHIGGVPPAAGLPTTSAEDFQQAVLGWLAASTKDFRLVAGVGNQVSLGTPEYKITMRRDFAEHFGCY